MLVYIISILYSLLFSNFIYKCKLNACKIGKREYNLFNTRKITGFIQYLYILVICLLPLIVMAIRYNVGTDYAGTYTVDFYLIRNGYNTRNEPFSALLYMVSGKLYSDPRMFFALTSFICVFSTFIGIYKMSANPVYSIYLYFITYQYFTSMNAVRQMMATSIVFCGTSLLLERQYMRFVVVVLIAGLFHYSAFLYLSLIPLFLLKMNFTKSIKWLLGLGIIAQILKPFLHLLIESTPYGHYLYSSEKYNASVIFIIVNIFVYIFMGLNEKKSERYKFFMSIQMVILIICFMQNLIPLSGRVLQLFSFYRMLIIPDISIVSRSKKRSQFFDWFVICFYTLYCIYGLTIAGWDDLLPYQTILTIH